MRRREFISLFCGAAAWPVAGHAQQRGRVFRIGTLDHGSQAARQHLWDELRRRLHELGYVEGRNIAFETRWADGSEERLSSMAVELAAFGVDVIVTATGAAARAAAQATQTLPIVMASGPDPVGYGLAGGLSRPTGNVTGVTTLNRELGALRLQQLKSIIPSASRVAVLQDTSTPTILAAEDLRRAGQTLGLDVAIVGVRTSTELASVLPALAKGRTDALLVVASGQFFSARRQLAELAIGNRLPLMASSREEAEAGALMSYGTTLGEGFRRAADFVAKILNGAMPADLPIEQPTTFKLIVNITTAKALGLTIPDSILARADEVIE